MTDETAPQTDHVPMTDPVPTPQPVKPGWQTTEFWLSTAAIALTTLFASGALTSTTALAIAGMAATVLTALGYKVSRTLVKTSAGALLLLALVASSSSCGAGQAITDTGQRVVDCARQDQAQITDLAGQLAGDVAAYVLAGTPINWDVIEARAETAGLVIGGCVLGPLIAGRASTGKAASVAPPANDAARAWAAFARLKAKANVSTFKTSAGPL